MACKDCIHYEACKAFNRMRQNVIDTSSSGAEKLCGRFADKSQFIQLPCKPEQPLYCLTYTKQDYVIIKPNHRLSDMVRWMEDGCFGTELFLTPEEAEAAIERSKDHG